jgi:3'-phosphoadenosine 5'-phosphosulfate sulfotransferase (PAPS reductase)/FAD synthetase
LEAKIEESLRLIREWHSHWAGRIYVSDSSGKDSSVLLHLARSIYPDIPAVFADTGLEFPESREFVKSHEPVETIRPKMSFRQVIERYGYPVVSKEQAGYIEDIRHSHSERLIDIRLNGEKLPDGRIGRLGKLSEKWKFLLDAPFKISAKCLMYGFNGFDRKRPKSNPLGFWTENDILLYIKEFSVPYSPVYGDIVEENGVLRTSGMKHTGCLACMFGVHLEKGENRFILLERTHPKLWEYCVYTLGIGEVLDYIGVPYSSVQKQTANLQIGGIGQC